VTLEQISGLFIELQREGISGDTEVKFTINGDVRGISLSGAKVTRLQCLHSGNEISSIEIKCNLVSL
jgi:hypothetical protein